MRSQQLKLTTLLPKTVCCLPGIQIQTLPTQMEEHKVLHMQLQIVEISILLFKVDNKLMDQDMATATIWRRLIHKMLIHLLHRIRRVMALEVIMKLLSKIRSMAMVLMVDRT